MYNKLSAVIYHLRCTTYDIQLVDAFGIYTRSLAQVLYIYITGHCSTTIPSMVLTHHCQNLRLNSFLAHFFAQRGVDLLPRPPPPLLLQAGRAKAGITSCCCCCSCCCCRACCCCCCCFCCCCSCCCCSCCCCWCCKATYELSCPERTVISRHQTSPFCLDFRLAQRDWGLGSCCFKMVFQSKF